MHVMLDLETFGTKPGCVIRSIGAQAFAFNGEVFGSFYENIEERSCLDAGLFIDPATADWWRQQDPRAQDAFLADPIPLADAVKKFHAWFSALRGRYLWCQGLDFDLPIWRAAADAVHAGLPWRYYNVRDTRTIYHLCDFDSRSLPFRGVPHNALDDARHSIECLSAALRRLMVPDEKRDMRDGLGAGAVFNLIEHLLRQRAFSFHTFGPGARTKGVLDHIRKEMTEIERDPDDLMEWIDVILLAFDGAWRAGNSPEAICRAIAFKQARNEERIWPDWRGTDPDKAIEHVRGTDEAVA